jgi:hypothetical protein
VVWILHRLDAGQVRARGGFSLLDLKHFSEARGYHAEGFSGVSMEELAAQKTSVITPIRAKGFRSLRSRKRRCGGPRYPGRPRLRQYDDEKSIGFRNCGRTA